MIFAFCDLRSLFYFLSNKDMLLHFFLKLYWFFHLSLWSISNYFLCIVWGRDWVVPGPPHMRPYVYPIFQVVLVKKTFLPLWIALALLLKNQITILVSVCFRTDWYSALLMFVSLYAGTALSQLLQLYSKSYSQVVISLFFFKFALDILGRSSAFLYKF